MLRRISFSLILALVIHCIFASVNSRVESQSGLHRLTNTPEASTSLNPTLSYDGSIVAFESTADLARTGIADGFHALNRRITHEEFKEIGQTRLVCPGLTSDGGVVVFASTEDLIGENRDRNSEIYLFHQTRLTQITHTVPDSLETRLSDGNFQPQISIDGRFIVFSTTRSFGSIVPGIALHDRTTSRSSNVAVANTTGVLSNPQISGDGSRVVFLSTDSLNNRSQLLAFNTETHETRQLATPSSHAQFSNSRAVSRDGSRIAFSAESAPNQSQVFLFDDFDGAIRQLTTLPSRSTDVRLNPTISGDGKRISFATRRRVTNSSDGSVELYVIDLPTGEIHQITEAPPQATAEVVSSLNEDGSTVVFNFSRLLSGPITNEDFANNSEIYVSAIPSRPAFGIGEAFNAAAAESSSSNTKTFAPDSLVNLKGNAFSVGTRHSSLSGGRFPLSLIGVTAAVNNRAAEVVYVSPNEVTVVLPTGLSNGPTELVVTNRDGFQIRAPIVISSAAPGLFSLDEQRTAAVLDASKLIIAPLDPTDGNLRLTTYGTGLRHAASISAHLNNENVAIENVVPSNVPGLDEIHLRAPTSFRGAGRVTFGVIADEIESNEVTFTLDGSPIRDVLINEFLADPPSGLEGDANHDGIRSASADEFIELVNTTTRDLSLAGYKLFTRTGGASEVERHRFPASSILSAGTAVVIFGGGNPEASNPVFGQALVQKASSAGLSLSNTSGAIILKNALGETVSSVNYGSNLGIPADNNQSITRFPDLVGPLSLFSQTGNGLFSPGLRVDGSPFIPNPAVATVEVVATRTQLLTAESMLLRATAFDLTRSPLSDVLFSWQTNPENIVSVDSNGLLTALRPGSTDVVATARGVSSNRLRVVIAQPTPTPTPTPSVTPTPSATPTPSITPSPSSSPTPSPTPSPSSTPSPSPSPSPTIAPTPGPSPSATPKVLITQIFGGGGNTGAPFRNDFIEIFNAGPGNVDLRGWSVQYASATASTWSVTTLSTFALASGQHYLIQEASGGGNGVQLPTPDVVGTIALAATAGKVALVKSTTALSGTCPLNSDVVDFVGYGSTASCFRGSGAAPAPSNTNAIHRAGNGCVDTQNNAADFFTGPPTPRNTSSTPVSCTQPATMIPSLNFAEWLWVYERCSLESQMRNKERAHLSLYSGCWREVGRIRKPP